MRNTRCGGGDVVSECATNKGDDVGVSATNTAVVRNSIGKNSTLNYTAFRRMSMSALVSLVSNVRNVFKGVCVCMRACLSLYVCVCQWDPFRLSVGKSVKTDMKGSLKPGIKVNENQF